MADVDLMQHGGAETSLAAFMTTPDFVRATKREQVRALVALTGGIGATCDELEAVLGWTHQTTSARVHELERSGAIHVPFGATDTDYMKRVTRSGKLAWVYVEGDPPPGYVAPGDHRRLLRARQREQDKIAHGVVSALKGGAAHTDMLRPCAGECVLCSLLTAYDGAAV